MIGKGTYKKALLYQKDIVQVVRDIVKVKATSMMKFLIFQQQIMDTRKLLMPFAVTTDLNRFEFMFRFGSVKMLRLRLVHLKNLQYTGGAKTVSNHKAHKLLGYKGKYSLTEGLTNVKDYYKES